MLSPLKTSVFQILSPDDLIAGTGFLVSSTLGVTCAHVVQSMNRVPGDDLSVQFHLDDVKYTVSVETSGWSPFDAGDIAFLRFSKPLTEKYSPVVLGISGESFGNDYLTLGYPEFGVVEARWPKGKIGGIIRANGKDCIELHGQEIKEGMSGAPVYDLKNNRVIGMISFYQDDKRPPNRFAYAVPAEGLVSACPSLRLWTTKYGVNEYQAYLEFLKSINGLLTLPDGRRVPLEKVYVSLRADEMNAAERKAEHDLYLNDVEKLKEQMPTVGDDPYSEHNFFRRVISQHPRMQMLIARNWQTNFAARKNEKLNLAEVVKRHTCVVLLGDPGSGKTTLGKWLSLQYARALQDEVEQLLVPLDLVQPDFQGSSNSADSLDLPTNVNADESVLQEIQRELDSLKSTVRSDIVPNTDTNLLRKESRKVKYGQVDLGAPRLPIFIRVAEYARYRWQANLDNGGSLIDFILRGIHSEHLLPKHLTAEAVGELCRDTIIDGKALIILDGLDEVGNPDQRRVVMQAINDFIDLYMPIGNRLLLTSRIVGYQFHPLTHLPHYTVEDMDESAIRAFCHAWMSHFYEMGDVDIRGKRLADTILEYDHPGVKSLAGNPLMLTLLAQVYKESGERALPHLRVDLFDETLHVLYKRREHLWDSKNITELRLARALAAVAYHLHNSESAGFTDRGTITLCLSSILNDQDQVEEVLNVADEAAGFLVSRGEGVYGFLHRALQEYFAARFLVYEPDKVVSRLLPRVLDPAWREIVILGLGLASQSRYPVVNKNEFLRKLWLDILEYPDPAGEALPRRALLLALASGECERFPKESLIVVVEQLLDVYGKRLAPVLQERIQRAFRSMQLGTAAEIVEDALCSCLEDTNIYRRWAAIDLIIETKWQSPSIVRALVKSWVNFVDPAGSLLVALSDLHTQCPEYFTDDFLPFRLALKNEPSLLSRIQGDVDWMTVVQSLYMRPGQEDFTTDVWRESPLTPRLLALLKDGVSVETWKTELISLAKMKETPEGRDAVLILAGLGEIKQVEALSLSDELTPLYRPYLISVLFMVRFDVVVDPDYENVLEILRVLSAKIFENTEDGIERKTEKEVRVISEAVQDINLARDLADQLRKKEDIDINYVIETVSGLSQRFSISFNIAEDLDLNVDHELVKSRALHVANRVIAHDFDFDMERSKIRRRLFDRYLSSVHSDVKKIQDALSFDEKQIKNIQIIRDLDVENDDNFDIQELSNFDIDLGKLSKYDQFIKDIKSIFEKILAEVRVDLSVRKDLEGCFNKFDVVKKVGWKKSGEHLVKVIRTSKFYSKVEKVIISRQNLLEISVEELVADLSSLQDSRRYGAIEAIHTRVAAMQLGRERIEKIAQLALQYSDQPQIGTQLSWTLHRVEFDCPEWIIDWIRSMKSIGDVDSFEEELLQSVYTATPLAINSLIAGIPHSSRRLNQSILNSLRWQGYYMGGLQDISASILKKIQDGFWNEKDIEIIECVLEVLGHWRPNPSHALKILLDWPVIDEVKPTWYSALSRIGSFLEDSEMRKDVEKRLFDDAKDNAYAAAGFVRLHLMRQDDFISSLLNIVLEHEKVIKILFFAGVDSDVWTDKYHSALITAIQDLCSKYPEKLIPIVLNELVESITRIDQRGNTDDINKDGWPRRRFALAAVAACVEVMPTEIQRVAGGSLQLEQLLVKGSKDPGSFNSRRFAITALGYLRTVSPNIVPVLIDGLRENVNIVQSHTLEAVSRFQRVEGDLISELLPYLTVENAPATAYGVAKLLGGLGTSPASDVISLRPQIIQAFANAIRHPNSQQDVILLKYSDSEGEGKIETESKGKLYNHLAEEMLRVAGWL